MKIVLTGPPCSGKSSVIEQLKRKQRNSNFVDEVARAEIEFFSNHEPHKLPWNDRDFFQNYVESIQLKNYVYLEDNHLITFYDRCLVDEIGYRQYFYGESNVHLNEICQNYRYDKVFYFPLWEEIYTQDIVRIETIEEARKQDTLIRNGYLSVGYELIDVPKSSIDERVEFILENINS
jgi:predicted ATPase